jgi:hypothetical protein
LHRLLVETALTDIQCCNTHLNCCTVATTLLHCWCTVVTLLLHCCHIVVTLLLHCCYTTVTLSTLMLH